MHLSCNGSVKERAKNSKFEKVFGMKQSNCNLSRPLIEHYEVVFAFCNDVAFAVLLVFFLQAENMNLVVELRQQP